MARQISFSLGGLRFFVGVARRREVKPNVRAIELGYVKTLEARYPELAAFGFEATAGNAAELAAFYAGYIPLRHPESRGAILRNLLARLRAATSDARIKAAVTRAIAISDLADGLPDRARALQDDPQWSEAWRADVTALENAYGAPLVTEDWSRAGRGASLIAFFKEHRALLAGKEVLHFAPEADLRAWLQSGETRIKRYVTADGFMSNVDQQHDITDLKIPDAGFDVVICHRVMEHVLDDTRGFSELGRILRPGGLLSFSVPQSPHQPKTVEWAIPDESHDGHVRQYGMDLEDRMRRAGFRVAVEPWLLNQPVERLRAQGAYPLRIYHAWREGH